MVWAGRTDGWLGEDVGAETKPNDNRGRPREWVITRFDRDVNGCKTSVLQKKNVYATIW